VALLHAVYASAERGGWVEVAAQPESERLGRPDDALASIYRTAPPDGRRK
jgi:hypothetical protein